MDVLIESTRVFEKDLDRLSKDEKAITVEEINDCVNLFLTQKNDVYRRLQHLPLLEKLNGYESSLYTLKISQKLNVVLTVDEDPIFGQAIFTLFRVVEHEDLEKAYHNVAKSLYEEIVHRDRKTARIS